MQLRCFHSTHDIKFLFKVKTALSTRNAFNMKIPWTIMQKGFSTWLLCIVVQRHIDIDAGLLAKCVFPDRACCSLHVNTPY